MSLLVVAPESLVSAAADVQSIGSALKEANVSAAVPTTGLLAAGADEVSAAVAARFSQYGSEFQALSAQVAKFHSRLVQTLGSAAGGYVSTEAANLQSLRTPLNGVGSVARPVESIEDQLNGILFNRLLPRYFIVGLRGVRALFPQITKFGSTGTDPTAPGHPIATRLVIYQNAEGQKVTLSVGLYANHQSAVAAFEVAKRLSEAEEGFSPLPSPKLGQEAFAGSVTQDGETHVGIGVLNGREVVALTSAGFPADTETIDNLTTLTRLQVLKAAILNFPFFTGPLSHLGQDVLAGVDRVAISSRS